MRKNNERTIVRESDLDYEMYTQNCAEIDSAFRTFKVKVSGGGTGIEVRSLDKRAITEDYEHYLREDHIPTFHIRPKDGGNNHWVYMNYFPKNDGSGDLEVKVSSRHDIPIILKGNYTAPEGMQDYVKECQAIDVSLIKKGWIRSSVVQSAVTNTRASPDRVGYAQFNGLTDGVYYFSASPLPRDDLNARLVLGNLEHEIEIDLRRPVKGSPAGILHDALIQEATYVLDKANPFDVLLVSWENPSNISAEDLLEKVRMGDSIFNKGLTGELSFIIYGGSYMVLEHEEYPSQLIVASYWLDGLKHDRKMNPIEWIEDDIQYSVSFPPRIFPRPDTENDPVFQIWTPEASTNFLQNYDGYNHGKRDPHDLFHNPEEILQIAGEIKNKMM